MAGPTRDNPLGLIFELHIEETVSDQQVQRVLAPVLAMVRQGESYQQRAEPQKRSILQYPYLITATAMVAVAVVALISNIQTMTVVSDHPHVEILEHFELPATSTPLAGPALFEKIAPGRADIIGGDIRAIKLAVVDTKGHLLGMAKMEDDGVFWFDLLPDAAYRAMALLPADEDASFSGIEIGSLVVAHGRASLVLSEGLENFWEGVEIRVCLVEESS